VNIEETRLLNDIPRKQPYCQYKINDKQINNFVTKNNCLATDLSQKSFEGTLADPHRKNFSGYGKHV